MSWWLVCNHKAVIPFCVNLSKLQNCRTSHLAGCLRGGGENKPDVSGSGGKVHICNKIVHYLVYILAPRGHHLDFLLWALKRFLSISGTNANQVKDW